MWFHWFYDRDGTKISDVSMSWMFFTRKAKKVHPIDIPYKAAGTVFTDGKLMLAAFQPHKKIPVISGIGGKREEGERAIYTAVRETLEELFEFKDISAELIEKIIKTIPPKKIIRNGSYVFAVYNFKDLISILKLVKRNKSPLYKKMPTTLDDLLFNREVTTKAELSHLSLLPVVPGLKIDVNLLEDIPQILD